MTRAAACGTPAAPGSSPARGARASSPSCHQTTSDLLCREHARYLNQLRYMVATACCVNRRKEDTKRPAGPIPATDPEVVKSLKKREAFTEYLKELRKARAIRWWFSWQGTALQAAWKEVLVPTVIAVVVTLVHKFLYKFNFDMTGHETTNLPVSFLLVFRTNIAFNRFWEGRIQLLEAMHSAKTLARKCFTHLKADPSHTRRAYAYIRTIPTAIRWDLQKEDIIPDFDTEARQLSEGEIGQLRQSPPGQWTMLVLEWLNELIQEACYANQLHSIKEKLVFEEELDLIQRGFLGMSAISLTSVPFPFTHLSKVLIIIWFNTLPVGMVRAVGWFTPFVVCALAFCLFGINHVGGELENPFGLDLADIQLDQHERELQHQLDILHRQLGERPYDDDGSPEGRKRHKAAAAAGPGIVPARRVALPDPGQGVSGPLVPSNPLMMMHRHQAQSRPQAEAEAPPGHPTVHFPLAFSSMHRHHQEEERYFHEASVDITDVRLDATATAKEEDGGGDDWDRTSNSSLRSE